VLGLDGCGGGKLKFFFVVSDLLLFLELQVGQLFFLDFFQKVGCGGLLKARECLSVLLQAVKFIHNLILLV